MKKLPCLRYRVHVNDQLIARFEFFADVPIFVKLYRNANDRVEVKVGHNTVWDSRYHNFKNIDKMLLDAANNGG